MTVDLQSRVVFVTSGEAPPMEVVRSVDHPRGVAEGRELDSFLAELDAGHDVPGLLVAAGSSKVIELLRRHQRTACLPIFFWGSGAKVEPGWDGNVVRWDETQLAQAAAWQEVLSMAHPVAELEEQDRRAHQFLRYLASRGQANASYVAVFGVNSPEAAIARWQRDGWVLQAAGDMLTATHDLLHRIIGDASAQPTATTQPTPAIATPAIPPKAKVHADVVASLLQESASRQRSAPAPLAATGSKRQSRARDVVLILLLGFVVFDLWSRYGAPFFAPQPLSEDITVARTPASPATILELQPTSMPPELSLDAHLSWEIRDYTAAIDGILEWRTAGSSDVRAGEVIAYLVQPQVSVAAEDNSLQNQLDAIYDEISELQTAANEDAAAALLNARQQAADARLQQSALVARVNLLQESYDRSRKLAEDGILSFREIRSDWEELQSAKEELAAARDDVVRLDFALEERAQREVPSIAEQPIWQTQVASLRLRMAPQMGQEIRIPVIAGDSGFFVQRVPDGSACTTGEVLGQLRKAGAGHAEAILATADWDPQYLQGVARLRRPGRSSWMPTRILSAESQPNGLTALRLRLPVGWLDGGSRNSVENATQLELRITAPLSSVHENK